MQVPLSLKMSATWENEKLSSSIVPRICNLSITQVIFDRLVEEKLDNSHNFLVAVRMRDNTRRVLRSPELAFPASIPGIVCLNFSCSIQYSHALKRDSSNLLQLLIQRPKKYKKKSVNFGYKTLAYCTIDLAQVLQRKIENKMLDFYEDPKSFSNSIGRIEVQSLSSSPAEKDMINDRRKEFYEEEDEGMHDQFSEAEDSDRAEDSDFDPNCVEFGESRQKKIMKAMSVGVREGHQGHRRSSSPSAALPEWQKQIKQKIMGLLKKVKLMEHNEVLDPRDHLWDEIDQFENASDDSDIGEMDSLSIQSTPRPMLRPFFGAGGGGGGGPGGLGGPMGRCQGGVQFAEDTLNADGGAKLLKKLQMEVNGRNSHMGHLEAANALIDRSKSIEPLHHPELHNTTQSFASCTTTTAPVNSVSGSSAATPCGSGHATSCSTPGAATSAVNGGVAGASSAGASDDDIPRPSGLASLLTKKHSYSQDRDNQGSSSKPGKSGGCCASAQLKPLSSVSASAPGGPTVVTAGGGLTACPAMLTNETTAAVSTTAPTTGAANSSSTTTTKSSSKKPISGIMKTFSLAAATTGNSNHQHQSGTYSLASIPADPLGGGLSDSVLGSPLSSDSSFRVVDTGSWQLSNPCSPTAQTADAANPRPELVDQVNELLVDYNESVDTIYTISLSDLGGKCVSELFNREHIPHIVLASFADTKFAISQIVNRARKRSEVIKICLLGGDGQLNNVLRVFIDQINYNYPIDLISCFRFFLVPISGLYSAAGIASLSMGGSNTVARRLCCQDATYASLFADFLQPESRGSCSSVGGSGAPPDSVERQNRFLFAVQDYLQATGTAHCPIGECLVTYKPRQQQASIQEQCESGSECFLPFVAEVRLGEQCELATVSQLLGSSSCGQSGGSQTASLQSQSCQPTLTASATTTGTSQQQQTTITTAAGATAGVGGGSGVSVVGAQAAAGRMDSSMDEQWLSSITLGSAPGSSPPRSPVISVGQDGPSSRNPLGLSSSLTKETSQILVSGTSPIEPVMPSGALEVQLEYWTDHSSKKVCLKSAFRQVLVSPQAPHLGPTGLTSQHLLALTIFSREKKQKIMRIAKKPKHDVGDTKRETFDDVNRILCTSKNQNSEIKVTIDGVSWSNVKFFQLSPCWRTQIKSFPIATFMVL